jgi:hypothetical protein
LVVGVINSCERLQFGLAKMQVYRYTHGMLFDLAKKFSMVMGG